MSRTVNGERVFEGTEKEMLRKHLWLVADYCGIQVMTYAMMNNHFHVLVKVPRKTEIPDEELVRRYKLLHPDQPRDGFSRVEAIKLMLAENGEDAKRWRRRQLAMMGDVSPFMQLFKQRFSIWFNRSHGRFGTLWAERFKSVLIEGSRQMLRTVAAYIDLNAVRAGQVHDPKDYRFCGYAEAVAGGRKAREGVAALFDQADWDRVQAQYRELLIETGMKARKDKVTVFPELLRQVKAEGGQLPLSEVLRCRLRYFSEGAVLGTQAFVMEQLERYRQKTGRGERIKPRPLPPVIDWSGMMALRIRKQER